MREKLLNYGYLWLGMKKISYGYALELFERGTKDSDNVYLLYEDNTENLAESVKYLKENWYTYQKIVQENAKKIKNI